jgi:hypothetical protein
VEEGGEEVLGLAQRLALHRTQTLYSLHQGREFLLDGEHVATVSAFLTVATHCDGLL